jgi:hypothetical protein
MLTPIRAPSIPCCGSAIAARIALPTVAGAAAATASSMHHRELVAAAPEHPSAVRHHGNRPPGDLAQHRIARLVAQPVRAGFRRRRDPRAT